MTAAEITSGHWRRKLLVGLTAVSVAAAGAAAWASTAGAQPPEDQGGTSTSVVTLPDNGQSGGGESENTLPPGPQSVDGDPQGGGGADAPVVTLGPGRSSEQATGSEEPVQTLPPQSQETTTTTTSPPSVD